MASALQAASLVLRGGRLVTLDRARPGGTALAARDGRIVYVGDDAGVRAYVGAATRVIELAGRTAVPGFIEGHGHFLGLGLAQQRLDLSTATSWQALIAQVASAARDTPPGQWIAGRGWHQAKWSEPGGDDPTHALSAAVPDHPALLTHASGHMCLVNAAAMRAAGVAEAPSGIFAEVAMAPLLRACEAARGALTAPAIDRALTLAAETCLAHGITSFHDAGTSLAVLERMRALASRGALGVRLWVMLDEDDATIERHLSSHRIIGFADHHLTVGAIKRLADGALGTHGAWLLAPYTDRPEIAGVNLTPLAALERSAQLALRYELQLAVHAIGDRANRMVLDLYQRVLPPARDCRWRIEHAQHVDPADQARFAELGVVAAVQGVHCTSDAAYVVRCLGRERARRGAYPWRGLLDTGAVVINGTDAPVESIDPLACFHASVTRQPNEPGSPPFFPEQRMTREEALRSYTSAPAWAAFQEHEKGSLSPGKLADVVVLSADLLDPGRTPDAELRQVRVWLTVVGGEIC